MIDNLFARGGDQAKAEMSFIDHLEALRWHIIRSVIAILVLAIIIFFKISWVFDNVIAGPINPHFVSYTGFCSLSHFLHLGNSLCLPPVNVNLQTTAFGGQFLSAFTIAFMGGFMVAFPYIFWEFWQFVKPALKPKELKNTRFAIFWVSFFFFAGAAFGYFVLAPFTFNFLTSFSISGVHQVKTLPTLNDYLDNLTNVILGCGIAFELPVLAFVLTKIGLLTPDFLKKSRKFAIVVILFVAAIITPSPDWVSQTLVFLPLFGLYQLSIVVSKRAYRDMLEKGDLDDDEEEEEKQEEWS